jgi:hypothetical protein
MDKLSTIKERWFEKQMLMLEDRGLNKTQIANKLGISTQHLNSMISGARGLSDNFLDNFIKTFNLQQIVLLPNQNPDNEVSFSAKSEHPIPLIPLSAFAGKGAKN